MADNVEITEGSGSTVGTDEVGGVHFQQVKLMDGTSESATVISAGAGVKANALRVTPASDVADGLYLGDIKFGEELPAGSNAIGKLAANSGVDIGDVDILSVPAPLNVTGGGTESSALRVTLANDSTGVITVDGSVTASNAAGDVAHDSADSGNPVKIGGKAVNMDGSAPGTAVAEGDRANALTDVYGRQLVETVHPNFWKVTTNVSTAQTATELKGPPSSGLSLYITDIIISNGATAGNIKLVEDTTSAIDIVEVMYLAANGGAVINLKTPIKLTANRNLGYTSVTCTTHSVTVCGYIAP